MSPWWSGGGREPGAERRQLLASLARLPGVSPAAIEAIARVPREAFVPPSHADIAYDDVALQIGEDATISAPSMVAEMLTVLDVRPRVRVLEIGAGSGYAAATIAAMGGHVIGLELNPGLASQGQRNLAAAGVPADQVRIIAADGRDGWSAGAPYDRILVSAAVEALPQAWLDQLAAGGRLVYPEAGENEDILVRLTGDREHGYRRQELGRCRFVRLKV